ncbi:uncharacterized protein DDB_G0287625-like [Chironomus tepperi]|uniref:uncharacterized protein DDB_G0287625-like n=1 Tax=Chironomus tepperi TaxID=113505 RepID=UPI00391F9769
MSEKSERMLVRYSKNDPQKSAVQLNQMMSKYHGANCSVITIKRRLRKNKLFGRRPVKKPLISAKNQSQNSENSMRSITIDSAACEICTPSLRMEHEANLEPEEIHDNAEPVRRRSSSKPQKMISFAGDTMTMPVQRQRSRSAKGSRGTSRGRASSRTPTRKSSSRASSRSRSKSATKRSSSRRGRRT